LVWNTLYKPALRNRLEVMFLIDAKEKRKLLIIDLVYMGTIRLSLGLRRNRVAIEVLKLKLKLNLQESIGDCSRIRVVKRVMKLRPVLSLFISFFRC
jgi:hypothetical protein